MSLLHDFPGLPQVVYLDSAATTQTPQQVVQAMQDYYTNYRANVHRGAYRISGLATEAYESARLKVAEFLSSRPEQCIFTRGTTDSLNLLAQALCAKMRPGQRLAVTAMEHHSNLVPWQQWALRYGLELDFVELTSQGC